MRSHQRNASAEPLIAALMAGVSVTEAEARDWVRELLRVEREGFSQRIIRRLNEARYYHGPLRKNELLASERVLGIIAEEVARL